MDPQGVGTNTEMLVGASSSFLDQSPGVVVNSSTRIKYITPSFVFTDYDIFCLILLDTICFYYFITRITMSTVSHKDRIDPIMDDHIQNKVDNEMDTTRYSDYLGRSSPKLDNGMENNIELCLLGVAYSC